MEISTAVTKYINAPMDMITHESFNFIDERRKFTMLSKEDSQLLSTVDPGTPMGGLFRRFWIPVLLSSELPAKDCDPVRVRILSEDLIAFRDSLGTVGLVDEYCPHRNASLFYGRNEKCGIQCAYHGWKFDVEGNCVEMPNEPDESNFKDKVKATAYPTQERGGVIWAYMGPKDKQPSLPEFEWTLVPDSHRYVSKIYMECNYLQGMEGDIDSSHSSFLHSSLGGLDLTDLIPDQKMRRKYSFADKAPTFQVKETDYGLLIGARRKAEEDSYYWRITQWLMPIYSMIPNESIGHSNIRVPIDNEHHWFFRVMHLPDRALTEEERYSYQFGGTMFPELIPGTFIPKANKSNNFLIDRALQRGVNFTGLKGAPTQDGAVMTSMGPVTDRTRERLGTSDTAIIQARRKLIQSARELENGVEPYPAYHGDVYKVRPKAIVLQKDVPFDIGAKEFLKSSI